MKLLLKTFLITFTLMQAVQAGRYYNTEQGRFIQRDPLGYVDGMSLYNAYFAEKFNLDPSGTNEYDTVRTTNPNGQRRTYKVDKKGNVSIVDKNRKIRRIKEGKHAAKVRTKVKPGTGINLDNIPSTKGGGSVNPRSKKIFNIPGLNPWTDYTFTLGGTEVYGGSKLIGQRMAFLKVNDENIEYVYREKKCFSLGKGLFQGMMCYLECEYLVQPGYYATEIPKPTYKVTRYYTGKDACYYGCPGGGGFHASPTWFTDFDYIKKFVR